MYRKLAEPGGIFAENVLKSEVQSWKYGGSSPRDFQLAEGHFRFEPRIEGIDGENPDWRAPISDKTPNKRDIPFRAFSRYQGIFTISGHFPRKCPEITPFQEATPFQGSFQENDLWMWKMARFQGGWAFCSENGFEYDLCSENGSRSLKSKKSWLWGYDFLEDQNRPRNKKNIFCESLMSASVKNLSLIFLA